MDVTKINISTIPIRKASNRKAKRQSSHDDFSKPQQPKKRQKREGERSKQTPWPVPENPNLNSSDKLRNTGNSDHGIPIPKLDAGLGAEFRQTPDGDIPPEDSVMIDCPPGPDEGPDTDHRTCFGVIIAEASFMLEKPSQINTISLGTQTGSNGVLKFYCHSSKRHLGSISLPTLTKLVEELSLTLTTFPSIPPSPEKLVKSNICPSNNSRRDGHSRIQVRIVIHGLLSDKTVVGDTLSSSHIFLQHPHESECLPGASYQNPHYFIRPGASMPRLEDLHISSSGPNGSTQRQSKDQHLTEADKSQLLRLFDTTIDVGLTANVMKQSPRLVTNLKDHQKMALTMMVEKECGVPVEKATFPQLWEKTTNKNGKVQYKHAITGVSRELPPDPVRGGILADEMGLGKTLSTLALITWHLDALEDNDKNAGDRESHQTGELRTTLIVTPKSTIHEWTQQIQKHIAPGRVRLVIYHGDKAKKLQLAAKLTEADIVLTTYDTVRSDAQQGQGETLLTHHTWARVILDEAHTIRNRSSQISKILSHSIRSPRRWCLTGTPIHNSLDDFGSLLAFIPAKPFDTHENFNFWILQPFKNDRTSKTNSESNYALLRLRKLIAATCIRRTKKGLVDQQDARGHGGGNDHQMQLPDKREVIEGLELDESDLEVYRFFKTNAAAFAKGTGTSTTATTKKKNSSRRRGKGVETPASSSSDSRTRGILPLIGILRLICNHGADLLPESALKAWRERDTKFVDWQTMPDTESRCRVCGAMVDEALIGDLSTVGMQVQQFSDCGHLVCSGCCDVDEGDGGDPMEIDDEGEKSIDGQNMMPGRCPACVDDTKKFPRSPIEDDIGSGSPGPAIGASQTYQPSAKVRALLRNLEKEHQADGGKEVTKSVVFSYWTRMLDLVEKALRQQGIKFQRIDGQTALDGRIKALKEFDHEPTCKVLLASIGSMGVGVNLTVANSVHILEPQWNPMVEAQATDRVHRIGQQRDVTVTRYFIKNSIETYVQCVQDEKLRLINRSLSLGKQQTQARANERHWKMLVESLQ